VLGLGGWHGVNGTDASFFSGNGRGGREEVMGVCLWFLDGY